MSQVNPFDEPALFNPFADPSVQQIVAGSVNAREQHTLEAYNPFNNSRTPVQEKDGKLAPSSKITKSISSSVINTIELQKRQEELEKKAAELDKREEELKITNNSSTSNQRNNWPPLPSKFCLQPCFYQDIQVEIQQEFQKTVQMLYYIWILHVFLYVLNVFGCMGLLIQEGSVMMFGLSILYCILFSPASYVFWFRPAYKAFKSDSSFNFMVFFVFFFSQLVATIIQAVGLPNLGTCGFIVALSAMASQSPGDLAVGIIALLIGIGFAVAALGDFIMLTKVSRLYRSSGGSLGKARNEFTSNMMRNEQVQQVTADVIISALGTQSNNPA